MTILAFVAKLAWLSLFVMLWLRFFGWMQVDDWNTIRVLTAVISIALLNTIVYLVIENNRWKEMNRRG